MPTTTAPDPAGRFQILVVTSASTLDDCRAGLGEAIEAPLFRERHALLVDRRAADLASVEFIDEMVSFMSGRREALAGSRAAIVTSGDAAFGMSRMLQLKAEARSPEMTIRAFRAYDDAVAWLSAGPTPHST